MACVPGFSLNCERKSFSSPYMSEQNYVRFRAIWALIFVVHGLYDQYTSIFIDEPSQSIWYYFYLTHQSRLVQSLGQLTEWMCARSFFKGEIPSAWISKTTMFCFVVGQPISLLVAVGYWLMVWSDLEDGKLDVTYYTVYNHGINGLLLFISFMISRMPYSCSNGGWVILAGILYLGFSLMQFLFRWGSFEPCEGYEDQRDCPIYEQFDWHKPLRTALFAFIAVAIGFIVILLYSGLAALRNCCTSGQTASGEVAELQKEDMEDIHNVTEPLNKPDKAAATAWPLRVSREV